MSETIYLNIALFREQVSHLRDSITNINSPMKTSETLDKTNIKPFIDDLENTIRALELFTEYQELFRLDVESLEQLGKKIRERDEQLSRPRHDIRDGYQPIQI